MVHLDQKGSVQLGQLAGSTSWTNWANWLAQPAGPTGPGRLSPAGSTSWANWPCRLSPAGSTKTGWQVNPFTARKKLFFFGQIMNNFYTDPNHTNLIVNICICCVALLTIVVVKCGCLETNHSCVNIIIELLLCNINTFCFTFMLKLKL